MTELKIDEQLKTLVIEVEENGNIRVSPKNVSPDEVTGIILRFAHQVRRQLGM